MWIIQNNRLHRVNPDNGYWAVLGNADWSGATSMTARWRPDQEALYIIQNNRLHQVNPVNGSYTVLPGQGGKEAVWDGPTSMAAIGDFLYVVQNSRLHRVELNGHYQVLPDQRGNETVWGGITAMAATWYPEEQLYIIQNNRLHRVSLNGHWEVLPSQSGNEAVWDGPVVMTAIGDMLYIVQNSRLHQVRLNGHYQVLPDQNDNQAVWGGATSITAVRDPGVESLYIVQNSRLHRVGLNGHWQVLPDQNGNEAVWGGASKMMQSFVPGRFPFPSNLIVIDQSPLGTALRIGLGTHKMPNQWRWCSTHLLGDTRSQSIKVWLELAHPDKNLNTITTTLKNCAAGAATAALVVAVATDGAALPAAKAGFIASFKACLAASIPDVVNSLSIELKSETKTGNWSGH